MKLLRFAEALEEIYESLKAVDRERGAILFGCYRDDAYDLRGPVTNVERQKGRRTLEVPQATNRAGVANFVSREVFGVPTSLRFFIATLHGADLDGHAYMRMRGDLLHVERVSLVYEDHGNAEVGRIVLVEGVR